MFVLNGISVSRCINIDWPKRLGIAMTTQKMHNQRHAPGRYTSWWLKDTANPVPQIWRTQLIPCPKCWISLQDLGFVLVTRSIHLGVVWWVFNLVGMGLASLELIIFTKEHLNSLHVPGDSAGGGHSQNLIPVTLELVGTGRFGNDVAMGSTW